MAIGADAVQRSRASKQADVLMTAALLPESWSEASLARNFAYYEPYCAHGSSLSPPVHALLAAWLRDGDRCRAYLEQTMAIDLGDGFRGAAGGVHLAALGGLWQATIFGLAGFKFTRERIAFDPYLPDGMQRLAFTLQWQGRRLQVRIEGRELAMSVDGPPCVVRVNQREETVEQGRPMTFAFDPGRTFWSSTHTEGPA
jgi:trehalose/maltose hydrolase-like predicted phosphorylase